jgi:uncharacterized membrane protein (DUF373 family)
VTDDQQQSDPTTKGDVPPLVRAGNRSLEVAEGIVYAGIAAFLLVLALGAFVIAGRQVPSLFAADGAGQAALEVLDTLLLVFIVVELLFAVRITIAKRELIAEPFLLVGIIASIKEIVVMSVKAADEIGNGTSFSDAMWEVGVLGVHRVAARRDRLAVAAQGAGTRRGVIRTPIRESSWLPAGC